MDDFLIMYDGSKILKFALYDKKIQNKPEKAKNCCYCPFFWHINYEKQISILQINSIMFILSLFNIFLLFIYFYTYFPWQPISKKLYDCSALFHAFHLNHKLIDLIRRAYFVKCLNLFLMLDDLFRLFVSWTIIESGHSIIN